MVCLIFHTTIIINRKNWRITIKLYFENLSIFKRTHMLGPPSTCALLFAFQGQMFIWNLSALVLQRSQHVKHVYGKHSFCNFEIPFSNNFRYLFRSCCYISLNVYNIFTCNLSKAIAVWFYRSWGCWYSIKNIINLVDNTFF